MVPFKLLDSRDQRWLALSEFISDWFPVTSGTPGVSAAEIAAAEERLGLQVPIALKEWYEIFGQLRDVWSVQDHFLPPAKWEIRSGNLIFIRENQAVVRWGTRLDDLGQPDPPVVVSDARGTDIWSIEGRTVSEFAIQFALRNAKFSNALAGGANGALTRSQRKAVLRSLSPIELPPMKWPGGANHILWRQRYSRGIECRLRLGLAFVPYAIIA
jgi:hypothetical protein